MHLFHKYNNNPHQPSVLLGWTLAEIAKNVKAKQLLGGFSGAHGQDGQEPHLELQRMWQGSKMVRSNPGRLSIVPEVFKESKVPYASGHFPYI